jgi:hypothetical protein
MLAGADLASYDAGFNEIEARYRWLKWPARMCFVFGVALILSGVVGWPVLFRLVICAG